MCVGKTCLKHSNLLFIIIFTVISMVEILFGIYMLMYMYKINRPEALGQQHIATPSLLLILFGISLFPLIVLGCCGFCKEIACCVNLYSSIVLILSILQILVGAFTVILFLKSNVNLTSQIKEDFTYSFRHYQKDPTFVNVVQKEMQCCGMISYNDWTNATLPSSCCGDSKFNCNKKSKNLYSNGCVDILTHFVLFWNTIIGYFSIGVGAFGVFVAIFGYSLGCGSYRYNYKI